MLMQASTFFMHIKPITTIRVYGIKHTNRKQTWLLTFTLKLELLFIFLIDIYQAIWNKNAKIQSKV